jgi:hypothetical protein
MVSAIPFFHPSGFTRRVGMRKPPILLGLATTNFRCWRQFRRFHPSGETRRVKWDLPTDGFGGKLGQIWVEWQVIFLCNRVCGGLEKQIW